MSLSSVKLMNYNFLRLKKTNAKVLKTYTVQNVMLRTLTLSISFLSKRFIETQLNKDITEIADNFIYCFCFISN